MNRTLLMLDNCALRNILTLLTPKLLRLVLILVCPLLLQVSASAWAHSTDSVIVPSKKRNYPFSKSLIDHQKALKTFTLAKDTPNMIQELLRVSVLQRLQGNPATSLDCILTATDLYESSPDSVIYYQIQAQLSEFCHYSGNFELSHKYAKKTLAFRIKTNDLIGQAVAHFRIGNSLRMQGCPAESLPHYVKAKKLRDRDSSLEPNLLYAMPEIAKAYMGLYRYAPALDIFRRVFYKASQDTVATFVLSDAYVNLAECLALMKNYDSAHYYATSGLAVARELGNVHHEKELNRVLNTVYVYQQDFSKAHAAINRYNYLLNLTQGAEVGSMLIETVLDWKLKATNAQMAVLHTRAEVAFLVQEKNRNRLYFFAVLSVCTLLTVLIGTWFWALKKRYHTLRLKGKMLAMRMNPHFIGNLLMAVQDALYEQPPEKIENYLSDTAAHIRHTLERSYDDWTPLTEELEELERYVQLQKLRFGSRLVYRVQLDVALPLCELSLPPFLIQPLLENAIEHGVRYQKDVVSEVLLKLETNSPSTLKCTLVNSHNTERPSDNPKRNKRSLSHKIIQERLSLYQMRSKLRPIRIEKLDSVTQVSLLIPIKTLSQKNSP